MAIVVVDDDVVVASVVVIEDSVVDESVDAEVEVDDALPHAARRSAPRERHRRVRRTRIRSESNPPV